MADADNIIEAVGIHGGNVALQEGLDDDDLQVPHKRREKRLETLSESVKPAELDKAIQFRKKNLILNWDNGEPEQYPVWNTDIKSLGGFGVGLELYFDFLKQSAFLFGIMGLVSICPIVFNGIGDWLEENDRKNAYDTFTLGNQYGIPADETSVDDAEDRQDKIDNNQLGVVIPDIFNTFVFILFLIYYRIRSSYVIERNMENNINASEYAIEVHRFPKEGLTEEEFDKHFTNLFGKVREVCFAREYHGQLGLYMTRAQISYKLGMEKMLVKERGMQRERQIRMLERKIEEFDQKIAKKQGEDGVKHMDERPVNRAYVVFEDQEVRKQCIATYHKENKCCRRWKNQPAHLKINGQHHIEVEPAVEPSNIQWENLEITRGEKCLRKFFILVITFLILVVSIALIYYVKTIEDDLPTDKDCVENGINGDRTLVEAKAQIDGEHDEFCWCKFQSLDDLINDDDISDYCEDYVERSRQATGVKIGSAVGVVMLNFIIKVVLILLSKFERISSVTKETLKIMTKVFTAMFINTAFISLIVNANLKRYEFLQDLGPFDEYVFNGEFEDFSRFWYIKVGSTIATTMVISIFSPHLINLGFWYPLAMCKRRFCWKGKKTQIDLNALYAGPEFQIATKLSQALNVIFTCNMYSSGMPFLNIVGFLALFLIFWTDKYLILRHYKKPPLYDNGLNDRVIEILPVAVFIHCLLAFYMYGCPDIFPRDFKTNDEGIVVGEDQEEWDRLFRPSSGIPYILLFIVCFLVIFFNLTLTAIIKKKIKDRSRNVHEDEDTATKIQKSFTAMHASIKAHGLDTYNILKNHKYRPLIAALDSAADKVAKLKEHEHDEEPNSATDMKAGEGLNVSTEGKKLQPEGNKIHPEVETAGKKETAPKLTIEGEKGMSSASASQVKYPDADSQQA